MADKIIFWEIRIGGMWVEVSERSFKNTMRIWCDNVHIYPGYALFLNKEGYVVGKMHSKEV